MTQLKNSTCRPRARAKHSIAAAFVLLCALACAPVDFAQAQDQGRQQGQPQGQPAGQNPVWTPSPSPTPQAEQSTSQPAANPLQTPVSITAPPPATQTLLPFSASGNLSFADRLTHLEAANNLAPMQGEAAIIDRIARLEQTLLDKRTRAPLLTGLRLWKKIRLKPQHHRRHQEQWPK